MTFPAHNPIGSVLAALLLPAALLLAWPAQRLRADENRWLIRPEDPPRLKEGFQRGSSGATVPVFLEPPVMPMRQSERKKPPAPDNLLAKAIWGGDATFTSSSGRALPIADWNLVTVDAERFIEEARVLGVPLAWGNVNLAEFSYDPLKTPCLLFSGVRRLRLHAHELARLRQYVLRGGMIVCDSVYGSPYFHESAMEMFLQAFPEERLRVVPADHPLLHIFHNVDRVGIPEQTAVTEPFLEGIYVGSRIGVLISKYGLGTGWHGDQSIMEQLKARDLAPLYYDPRSARLIGVNIAAYVIGYAEAAAAEAAPEMQGQPDPPAPTDEFVFAQLRHEGAWNAHPGAAAALLNRLRRTTTLRVHPKRAIVDPSADDLAPYPFLYLTGLDDFTFPEAALSALQAFTRNGGLLLANNALGLSTFHAAVMRELPRLVPGGELVPLPPDHPLFHCLVEAAPARYTDSLLRVRPDLGSTPLLLGLEISGRLCVVYSPYDLEAGWLNSFYPLLRGYENESALRLGMNLVTYAMTR